MAPRFVRGQGMDLVDDDVLHAAKRLARLAGEQQVEALRGGDQDVGRVLGECSSRIGGGVAGPRGDADLGQLPPIALRRAADPGQRCAEVALDVVGERLERADVQDAHAALAPGGRDGTGSLKQRSRHHRKAARVFPLPVGAWRSVWCPALIAAQPRRWARVGSAKASANQARVGSLKGASGSETARGLTVHPSLRAVPDSIGQQPSGMRRILDDPGSLTGRGHRWAPGPSSRRLEADREPRLPLSAASMGAALLVTPMCLPEPIRPWATCPGSVPNGPSGTVGSHVAPGRGARERAVP